MRTEDMVHEVEMLLWKYWDHLPEPKISYTTWFYEERKDIVQWLFSKDVRYV